MNYLIILGALVLVPVLLIMILRVNAAIAFMSLALGSVLVHYTSPDVVSLASGLSSKVHTGLNQYVSLALLIVPFVLTIIFTRKNVQVNHQLLNFLPALASGLLFALMVTPLLSSTLQIHIEALQAWKQLDDLQTAIILGGAFFSLLFLLVTHRHHRKAEKHAKH